MGDRGLQLIAILKYSFFSLLLLVSCGAFAASQDTLRRIQRISVMQQFGVSYFHSNTLQSQSKFVKTDVRLVIRSHHMLASWLELTGGVGVGVKMKGSRRYPPGSTSGGLPLRLVTPLNELEEAVNSTDHFYLEVPLMAFATIYKGIRTGIGVSGRQFFPNKGNEFTYGYGDFFSFRKEWGVNMELQFRLSRQLRVTGSAYAAMSRIYSITGYIDGSQIDYKAWNRSVHIGVEYFPFGARSIRR